MIISICPHFSSTSLYCLFVSHSPSPRTVNSDLKWQCATTPHKPTIFLPLLLCFLLSFTFFPFQSGTCSFPLFNPPSFYSILIPLLLYLLSSSPTSLTVIGRQPERGSEGIRLGLKCNIRLLKRLVVEISPSEPPPNLMNWHS